MEVDDESTGEPLVKCIDNTSHFWASNFNVDLSSAYRENCLVYEFLRKEEASNKYSYNVNGFCQVCKHGWRLFNGACIEIQNCDKSISSEWVNSCEKCLPGFAWDFNTL